MMTRSRARVAVVTGASSGAGRAYALALAGAGFDVFAVARSLGKADGQPARQTLREVEAAASDLQGAIHPYVCDVTQEAQVEALFAEIGARFGSIEVLVNNAGIYLYGDILEATAADWNRTMDINLKGAFFVAREATRMMIAQGRGSIINITSGGAGITQRGSGAHDGLGLYGISKAGLNRMTTYLAAEYGPRGLTVNALSPGWVDAKAFSADEADAPRKPATPEVLGPAMLFLALEAAAAGVNGQILHSDDFGTTWPIAEEDPFEGTVRLPAARHSPEGA